MTALDIALRDMQHDEHLEALEREMRSPTRAADIARHRKDVREEREYAKANGFIVGEGDCDGICEDCPHWRECEVESDWKL